MKVTAKTLPRISPSDTGMLSCEIKVKAGAGPITGSRLSPPASCASSHVGNTNSADASRTPATSLLVASPSLTLPRSRWKEGWGQRREKGGMNGIVNLMLRRPLTPSVPA